MGQQIHDLELTGQQLDNLLNIANRLLVGVGSLTEQEKTDIKARLGITENTGGNGTTGGDGTDSSPEIDIVGLVITHTDIKNDAAPLNTELKDVKVTVTCNLAPDTVELRYNGKIVGSATNTSITKNIFDFIFDIPAQAAETMQVIAAKATLNGKPADNAFALRFEAATDDGDNTGSKVYYGVAEEPTELNTDFIENLTNTQTVLSCDVELDNKITAGSDQYIWIAIPSDLDGSDTCQFSVGGFVGGFENPEQVGNYYVYRSSNVGLQNVKIILC